METQLKNKEITVKAFNKIIKEGYGRPVAPGYICLNSNTDDGIIIHNNKVYKAQKLIFEHTPNDSELEKRYNDNSFPTNFEDYGDRDNWLLCNKVELIQITKDDFEYELEKEEDEEYFENITETFFKNNNKLKQQYI